MAKTPKTRGWPWAAIVLVLVAGAAWGQPRDTLLHRDDSVTVEVPGDLGLPDGSILPADTVTLRFLAWYTPSAGLYALDVDGRPWGYLLSRAAAVETVEPHASAVVFERDRTGRARLIGCALPHRRSMLVHVFHMPGGELPPELADPAELLRKPGETELWLAVATDSVR